MADNRTAVAVIMGGRTPEHSVSLSSGVAVVNHLDRTRYRVKPVRIDPQGRWRAPRGFLDEGAPPLTVEQMEAGAYDDLGSGQAGLVALMEPDQREVDVAFLALHGPYGEDGTVQGLCEIIGLPYTGSGVLASSLAMDKIRTQSWLAWNEVRVPPSCVASAGEPTDEVAARVADAVGFPCVAKPSGQGSSIGVGMVDDASGLETALSEATRFDADVLVEARLAGRELTCAVLEDPRDGSVQALPVIEIVPKTCDWFDYVTKYDAEAVDEICPAPLETDVAARVQALAERVHRLIGCWGFSRTDFILTADDLYVLEINTIPGLTPVSLLPKAVAAAGMDFPLLLDRIIECALRRHGAFAAAGAVSKVD